jgi:hypothetical protein
MAYAAVAAAVIAAAAAVQQGQAAKAQGKAQQSQYEAEAQSAETAGKQTSANLRREFGETLSTITAMRGSRNLGADSPTGYALEQGFEQDSVRNRVIAETGYLDKAAQSRYSGRIARFSGDAAATTGYLKAGSSLLSAAGNAYATN